MKKVAFLMYHMEFGGVQKSLYELLKTIDYSKYSVDLLVLSKTGIYLDTIDKCVNVIECNVPYYIKEQFLNSTLKSIKKCLFRFKIKDVLNLLYKKFKFRKDGTQYINNLIESLETCEKHYDIAIDYQGMNSFTTKYCIKKINAEKKVSWNHNDISHHYDGFIGSDDAYSKFDYIYSVSKSGMEKFAERFPVLKNKCRVFYNVIDFNRVLQKSEIESPLKDIKTFKIMTVGRLAHEKGYDVALRVVRKLRDCNINFKYYIVGDGILRNDLEKYINTYELNDVVEILGFKENPYVYLKDCDLYMQTSRQEGFCIALTEAKIFNKIIVTTDFAGAREQVVNGKTGFIVECNEDKIFSAVKEVIENADLRKNMQKAVHESELCTNGGFNINDLLEI